MGPPVRGRPIRPPLMLGALAFLVLVLGAAAGPDVRAQTITSTTARLPLGLAMHATEFDAGPSSGCLGGCAFILGGLHNAVPQNKIYRFNPTNLQVSEVGIPLPIPIASAASVIYNRQIFLFGGFNDNGVSRSILRYDVAEDSVTLLSVQMPLALQSSVAAVAGAGHVYIFGGANADGYSDRIMHFTPSNQQIELLDQVLPHAFSQSVAVHAQDRIFILGGSAATDDAKRRIIEFNPQDRTSVYLPARLDVDGTQDGAAILDGSGVVWHFGGSGNQISDQVGTWTPRSSAWSSQKFSSMKARYDHTAVWTGNDGYLFGGTVSGGSVYSDEILRFDRFGVEPQPTPTTTTPVPSTTNPAPTTPGPLTGSITPSTGLTTQGPTLEGTQEGEGPDGLPSQGPSDETSQPFGFSLTSVILIGVLAAGVAAPLGYVVFSSLRGKPAAIPVVAARTAPALGGPAMEVREVTVMRGGKPAIEGITFAAPAGQLTLLLGPSGSGKSTLLEAVVGLQPFRGQVLIAGEGAAEGTRKKSLGYVPQELQLYPNLNAEQNLVYFASQYGVASREARATARTLLERLGLADAANRPLSQLSGGQQRRVSIAAAMVHEPRLLVLDEPTSGLDYSARRSLWTLLQQISREHGLGVVATSHFMDDAQYADRIGVVDRGRLVSFGTLKQLLQELPGDGRCAVAEFDELQPADLAKLQNLLRSLQKEGLAERMDIKSFSARFYSKNPKGLSRVLPTLLERQGLAVRSTGLEELTVEDVFVYRTGRSPGAAP